MDVSTPSSTSTDAIDGVFSALHGMIGNRFLDAYRSGHVVNGVDTGIENMKATWLQQIRARGITRRQIERGLAGCVSLKFPPTLGEFLALCQPEVDPIAAYQEAVAGLEARDRGEVGEWSHPAVYWAASSLRRELQQEAYGSVRERWLAALKRQMARGAWEPIPQPHVALPAPGQAFTSREAAGRTLRELGASGILRRADDAGDQRAWVAKVLARAAAGDPSLPAVSLRYARQLAADAGDGADPAPV